MQFNPTDKSNSIIGDIDFLLFGSSTTFNSDYSLADRTRNLNISYDEVVAELYKADPNYKWDDTTNSDYPIARTNLVAGKDNYLLLDSAQVIHRIRVKDQNGSWVTLTSKVRSNLTDSELSATGGTPDKYFKFGGGVFPLPVPDYGVTKGFEIEFQRSGNHFTITDTTKSPGFNAQFHQILSVKAAKRYALANGMSEKVSMLDNMLTNNQRTGLMDKMLEHYQIRSLDEKPKFKVKRDTSNYGL
jgi:hypothetical protein